MTEHGRRTKPGEPLRFIHEVVLHHVGDGCLPWPFAKTRDGYGLVWISGKNVIASRYICELAHGSPPTPEHEAAHSCGNGRDACISPDHLSWKTSAENKADMLIHGTHTRGERNAQAKLTEAAAREILALRGKESQVKLAKRFMVGPSSIWRIHTGRSWAWVAEGETR
jgi:hypothetical protein